MNLFKNPDRIEDVFCKVLTANDDSGRHGVLIPSFAYRIFPKIRNFVPDVEVNYTEYITTHWKEAKGWIQKDSKWIHYHRYPERRITSLSPELLNDKEPYSIVVVGKLQGVYEYECLVLYPSSPDYKTVGDMFGLAYENGVFSGSAIKAYRDLISSYQPKKAIDFLVEKIHEVKSLGYVKSMRDGDTGIGYTFETLIGIDANSSKDPDFMGIEIKTSRSKQPKETRRDTPGKQTLFSLIPQFDVAGDRTGLVRDYGYYDEKRDRIALYCTIKVVKNSLGWSLKNSYEDRCVYVCKDNKSVVSYNYCDLQKSLEDKHKESTFIIAHSVKENDEEYFHYDTAIHCQAVVFEEFLNLLDENLLGVDFAIHLKENGVARDHGFLWRIENKKYLYRLFKYVTEVV